MPMTDEKINALLDEFEQKKNQAESIAQMEAMNYVKSADEKDRASAQKYLRDAGLWNEARQLLVKHRAL